MSSPASSFIYSIINNQPRRTVQRPIKEFDHESCSCGSGTGIRTPIARARAECPAVGRFPNVGTPGENRTLVARLKAMCSAIELRRRLPTVSVSPLFSLSWWARKDLNPRGGGLQPRRYPESGPLKKPPRFPLGGFLGVFATSTGSPPLRDSRSARGT